MITPETMLIVAGAAFLLFGGKKLPELGRSLGDGIREFRSGTQGLKAELENSVAQQPAAQPVQTTAVSAASLAAPQTVILPSAPVAHTIELGKPVHAEDVVVVRQPD